MKRNFSLAAAVAAGFFGGLLSQSVTTGRLHAQAQPPAQKEIRAQNFIVVNGRGEPLGLFGLDPNGRAIVKLVDEQGRTVWSSRPEALRRSPSGE